jgi:cytochrome c oxidase subunit 1
MKNVSAILIWGVMVFAVGAFLDRARTMLMTDVGPLVTYGFRFVVGFVLVVVIVLVRRLLRKWMADEQLGPGGWFGAGAIAWALQGVYVWLTEPRRTLDLHVHDRYFVISYLYVAVEVSAVFWAFAALYYSYKVVTRRSMSPVLGKVHFWVTHAALYVVLWLEYYKYPVKTNPEFLDWVTNREVSLGYELMASALLGAQVLFVFNMIYSLLRKRKRGRPKGRGSRRRDEG